jgi:prepilin-type N-terminal cleavage/methylation domain-containing protein
MRKQHGFTLIELLIVVVIIGILASIAIPKFANTKDKAFKATMRSDLRNLATAQEAYIYDNTTYYAAGVPGGTLSYNPSTGVSIALSNVTVGGWAAAATHTGVPGVTCALYVGMSAAVSPATQEGLVACN